MLTVSSWDFTMENYGAVWAFMVQLELLLLFLVHSVGQELGTLYAL